MSITVRPARADDATALAELAAQTFPLACPPTSTPERIAAHITRELSAERFIAHLASDRHRIAVAETAGQLTGYTMLVLGTPPEAIAGQLHHLPSAELSKIYVRASGHGAGVAGALMLEALAAAGASGVAGVWLGTNQANLRAQRFYEKHGFRQVGTRRFRLSDTWEEDFVYERAVTDADRRAAQTASA
ncbi:MAG TPA: GNAT family N-acetyltransferase [Solirubrobacteraceae bacterium]|nr:GNAT family N-acetyltransferase [Solirubrobacteraceae bacterium]